MGNGQLCHLSQACLDPETKPGASARVLVEQAGTKYALAILKEGGQECCALDLFLDLKEAKLTVEGKAAVHLTGYFETDGDGDESGDEEMAPPAKKAEPKAEPKVFFFKTGSDKIFKRNA